MTFYQPDGAHRGGLLRSRDGFETSSCRGPLYDASGGLFTTIHPDGPAQIPTGMAAFTREGVLRWRTSFTGPPFITSSYIGLRSAASPVLGKDGRLWSIVPRGDFRTRTTDALLAPVAPHTGTLGTPINVGNDWYGSFAATPSGLLAGQLDGTHLYSYTGDLVQRIPAPPGSTPLDPGPDLLTPTRISNQMVRSTDNGLIDVLGRCQDGIPTITARKQTVDGPSWVRASGAGPAGACSGGFATPVRATPNGGAVFAGDIESGDEGLTELSAQGATLWREDLIPASDGNKVLAVSNGGIAVLGTTEPGPCADAPQNVCVRGRVRFRQLGDGSPARPDIVFSTARTTAGAARILAIGIGADHVFAAVLRDEGTGGSSWYTTIERISAPGIGGDIERQVVPLDSPTSEPPPSGLPPVTPPPDGTPTQAASYASLGDSYSSGEGVRPYHKMARPAKWDCHRSKKAYPDLLSDKDLTKATNAASVVRRTVSCSGARTRDVYASQKDTREPRQADAIDTTTRLVTVGLGGNDALFPEVMLDCVQLGGGCRKKFDASVTKRIAALRGNKKVSGVRRLSDVYELIVRKAYPTRPKVLVLDYPMLFAEPEYIRTARGRQIPVSCKVGWVEITGRDIEWLRQKQVAMNAAIRAEARRAGVQVVNVAKEMRGRELCGAKGAWLNGAYVRPSKRRESFHPNAAGQRAMAKAVAKALG